MQSVSGQFNSYASGDVRPLSWHLLISFSKDVVDKTWPAGTQDWNKYEYAEYTDRLVNVEWEREVDFPSSISMAMCDIELDNHDGYFAPGGSSEISADLLPGRPIKLFTGFNGILIPQFVGLTMSKPQIDDTSKTVTFHCEDFVTSLMNKTLLETATFVDQRIDEILLSLFEQFGLSATQLELDEAFTTVPYASFKKDDKLGDALKKLMEAEQGRLFMSEAGVITFKNRQNYDDNVVWTFDPYGKNVGGDSSAFNDIRGRTENEVINVVEITGRTRTIQPNQPYGVLDEPKEILAGQSEEIFIEFPEPVISADDPVYEDSAVTSSFSVNTAEDGSGSADSTNVTLTSSSVFDRSTKLTFTNASGATRYITAVEIYAVAAVPTGEIYAREFDQDSIDINEERVLPISNDFYQDSSDASAKAQVIIRDWADADIPYELDVKGNFALQIDDTIKIDNYGVIDNHKIFSIKNKIMDGRFQQVLRVRAFEAYNYFTIGVSAIGGTDEIFP